MSAIAQKIFELKREVMAAHQRGGVVSITLTPESYDALIKELVASNVYKQGSMPTSLMDSMELFGVEVKPESMGKPEFTTEYESDELHWKQAHAILLDASNKKSSELEEKLSKFEVMTFSEATEIIDLIDKLAVSISALGSLIPVLTYAYEDTNDTYYLNALDSLNKSLEKIK